VLGEVYAAVLDWRQLAVGPGVGLRAAELDDLALAFEHE
jgi:serine/threonine-protein kinase HipA